jgi:hypothetical protein
MPLANWLARGCFVKVIICLSTDSPRSSFDKSRTVAKLQSVIDFGELEDHPEFGKIDRSVEALDDAVFPSAILAAGIQMRIWRFRIDEQERRGRRPSHRDQRDLTTRIARSRGSDMVVMIRDAIEKRGKLPDGCRRTARDQASTSFGRSRNCNPS